MNNNPADWDPETSEEKFHSVSGNSGLHVVQEPDQIVNVSFKPFEEARCLFGSDGSIRGCLDVAELLQHMEGIPDAVGRPVEEFGKFHDPDGLVFDNSSRNIDMPAEQFDLFLHLPEHGQDLLAGLSALS